MGTLALIGLGSNLGDRKAILDQAVAALAETPGVEVRAVSSYHETLPVGGPPGQGPFLNAAAAVECKIAPLALLDAVRQIETAAGRKRDEHWAARTLDIDLLLFGDLILDRHPKIMRVGGPPRPLVLPHPWLPFRRFVLAPAAEIAAEMVDPVTCRSIAQLLANLDRRPSYVALAGDPGPRMRTIAERLVQELNAIGVLGGGRSWNEIHQQTLTASEEPSVTTARFRIARDQAVASLAQGLRRERWQEKTRSDRWIVSDAWLEQGWWQSPASHPTEFNSRELFVQPTFVAMVPSWDHDFLYLYYRQHHGELAAMVQSRAQSLPPLMTRRLPTEPKQSVESSSERIERLISAILDACRATRS